MRSIVLCALILTACHAKVARSPQAAVESFYAEVGRRDCAGLKRGLTQQGRARIEEHDPRCETLFSFHGPRPLERIVSVKQDGRHAQTQLVAVEAAEARALRVFSVVAHGSDWRLETF